MADQKTKEEVLPFKVHIRGIAREAKELRRLESSEIQAMQVMRLQQRIMRAKITDRGLHRFLKEVAFGQRPTIDKPHTAPPDDWIGEREARRWNLHQRRAVHLRKEARVAHLAYGFLLGVPLKEMEEYSYEPPPWDWRAVRAGEQKCPVTQIIMRFTGEEEQVVTQRLAQWIEAGGPRQHPTIGPRWWVKQEISPKEHAA